MHREALDGCMYYTQTQSRQDRLYRVFRKIDKLREQLHGKYLKRTYNGKPTKKYIRLMKEMQRAGRVEEQVLRVLSQKVGNN